MAGVRTIAIALLKTVPSPAIHRRLSNDCARLSVYRVSSATSYLLLCAGVELDAQFAQTVARTQRDSHLAFPSFCLGAGGVAGGPLERAHAGGAAPALAFDRSDRRRDARPPAVFGSTNGCCTISPACPTWMIAWLGWCTRSRRRRICPTRKRRRAEMIVSALSVAAGPPLPVIQICGDDSQSQRAVAALACAKLGLGVIRHPRRRGAAPSGRA